MTVAQLVQLYAPLAGLLILAFWTGGLSTRVRVLERERKEDKDAADKSIGDEKGVAERLLVLETTVSLELKRINTTMEHIGREFTGVQRQMADLGRASGKIIEFGRDHQ